MLDLGTLLAPKALSQLILAGHSEAFRGDGVLFSYRVVGDQQAVRGTLSPERGASAPALWDVDPFQPLPISSTREGATWSYKPVHNL